MIGTLIGDFAASSWENNRDLFYSDLITTDLEPSVYGRALMNAGARFLLTNQAGIREPEVESHSVTNKAEWLMWSIAEAWVDKPKLNDTPILPCQDKELSYAREFIHSLIRALRNGATKSDAFNQEPMMLSLMRSEKWRHDVEPSDLSILSYVFRAWDSFYRGFDFTSSIHNAMKWSGDKHLLGALTGSFADAMYGCHYNMIKRKYEVNNNSLKELPIYDYTERPGLNHELINLMIKTSEESRTFYPKNSALTNVERHRWTPVMNPFENVILSKQERDRILISAPTGWECRYGLYLDDGWIYSYRSRVLIGRFKIKEESKDSWQITQLQCGQGDFKSLCLAMNLAIYDGCHIPKLVDISNIVNSFKYFNGELNKPEELEHTTSGKFWHGERMFAGVHDKDMWMREAEDILTNLKGEKLEKFSSYTPCERATLVFIDALFSKWCPLENKDWIFEY